MFKKKKDMVESYYDNVIKREYLNSLEGTKQDIVKEVIDLMATQEMLRVLVEDWADYKAVEKEIETKKRELLWVIGDYDTNRAEMLKYLKTLHRNDFKKYNYYDLIRFPTSHEIIKNTIILYRSGKF